MAARPILYSTLMVQAQLAGRKTKTRRVVRMNPFNQERTFDVGDFHSIVVDKRGDEQPGPLTFGAMSDDGECCIKCPYGKPGDILWVKEAFNVIEVWPQDKALHVLYEDGKTNVCTLTDSEWEKFSKWKDNKKTGEVKVSSLFMFQSLARIWHQIEDIRVERLHDISEEDAKAEGVEVVKANALFDFYRSYTPDRECYNNPIDSFRSLWQSINGEASWDANPWVWVVSFKVLSTNGKPQGI